MKIHILETRVKGIYKWLKEKHPEVFEEQKHLDKGIERIYWHYGYLMAIIDFIRNFNIGEEIGSEKNNNVYRC